jgi:hypothetical protein
MIQNCMRTRQAGELGLTLELGGDYAAGTVNLLAIGFVAGFFLAIDSYSFRMFELPGIRKKLGVVGLAGQQ